MDRQMPPTGASDKDLIARFRAGDDRAFVEIYSHWHESVFNWICQGAGSSLTEDDAWDVFVEVWRKAYKTFSNGFDCEYEYSVRNWLSTVQKTTKLDHIEGIESHNE